MANKGRRPRRRMPRRQNNFKQQLRLIRKQLAGEPFKVAANKSIRPISDSPVYHKVLEWLTTGSSDATNTITWSMIIDKLGAFYAASATSDTMKALSLRVVAAEVCGSGFTMGRAGVGLPRSEITGTDVWKWAHDVGNTANAPRVRMINPKPNQQSYEYGVANDHPLVKWSIFAPVQGLPGGAAQACIRVTVEYFFGNIQLPKETAPMEFDQRSEAGSYPSPSAPRSFRVPSARM